MTNEQFEQLFSLLKEINENIKLITAQDTGKGITGLSDVYSELGSVTSGILDVERAVKHMSK